MNLFRASCFGFRIYIIASEVLPRSRGLSEASRSAGGAFTSAGRHFFAGRVFVFLEGGSIAGGGYEIEIGKEILLQRAVCRPVFVGSGDGFRLRLLWV